MASRATQLISSKPRNQEGRDRMLRHSLLIFIVSAIVVAPSIASAVTTKQAMQQFEDFCLSTGGQPTLVAQRAKALGGEMDGSYKMGAPKGTEVIEQTAWRVGSNDDLAFIAAQSSRSILQDTPGSGEMCVLRWQRGSAYAFVDALAGKLQQPVPPRSYLSGSRPSWAFELVYAEGHYVSEKTEAALLRYGLAKVEVHLFQVEMMDGGGSSYAVISTTVRFH